MPEEHTDTASAGLTAEDVRNVVTDVVAQPLADGAASTEALRGDVSDVLGSVHDLSLQVSESSSGTVVMLDDSQYQRFDNSLRVLCTEGLILTVLIAALCGLSIFRILTGGWHG